MKTFHIQTLGCRVNHYESEQIAALLISRGLTPSEAASADLRVVHTCSVTTQAASQSRQAVRRMVKLPVLSETSLFSCGIRESGGGRLLVREAASGSNASGSSISSPKLTLAAEQSSPSTQSAISGQFQTSAMSRPRVLVTGCWATSNSAEAALLPGVDAVVSHHQDVAGELDRLLKLWQAGETLPVPQAANSDIRSSAAAPESLGIESKRKVETATPAGQRTPDIEPKRYEAVNDKVVKIEECRVQNEGGTNGPHKNAGPPGSTHASLLIPRPSFSPGTTSLPLLSLRQSGRQRAFLKIQDGCDAHCTYCIIPSLRPSLWSKPIDAAVEEATALVAAGHVEIVLTGIFLGAYGQNTALRRRQSQSTAKPLGELIDALCTRVPGLKRLRLSSLEPGDLTAELLAVLRSHPAVMPHFHLPLQSGSDLLLRRMNRQYTRDDFMHMIDRVKVAFDRPALTTDVVVGFPGETDAEFERTVEVVRAAGFIHVHAFPYSPRPGTAAARWTKQFVRGPVVNERIERLRIIGQEQSLAFRSTFVGETVEVIVERDANEQADQTPVRHGRCERYFSVELDNVMAQPGDAVLASVAAVTAERTFGVAIDAKGEVSDRDFDLQRISACKE
jgi:threonylcarbamoyladenosine tRNA methylthiotransferase MtaB